MEQFVRQRGSLWIQLRRFKCTYEEWMMQMVRNLTDPDESFLRHTRFLITDRETKYSVTFRAALTRERIEPIRLPPRPTNLNALA
jgi:putative transposase